MSSNKSKLFLTFAVGAALGAVVTALFTTEKGKKILGDIKSGLDEFGNDLRDKVKESRAENSETAGSAGDGSNA